MQSASGDNASSQGASQADGPGSHANRFARSRRWRWIGTGLVLLFVWTYVPLSRAMNRGPVYTRLPDGEWSVHNEDTRRWRGLRTAWARGEHGAQLATQIEDRTATLPFPTERIWVLCRTPGRVAHHLGVELTERLLERAGMQEVGFFTYRQLPNSAFRPPDLWITLDRLEETATTVPGRVTAQGRIQVRLAQTLLAPDVEFLSGPQWVGQLTYDSHQNGFISAAGRWQHLVSELADQLAIESVLDRWQAPAAKALPAIDVRWLHAPIRCETIMAFKGRLPAVQQVCEGPAWMLHDATAWTIETRGDTQGVAQAFIQDLEKDGWRAIEAGPGSARMQLGDRQLDIRPLFGKPGQSLLSERWSADDDRPLGVFHLHPFSTEERANYLRRLVREKMPTDQLRTLVAHLGQRPRQALRQHLRDLHDSTAPEPAVEHAEIDALLIELLSPRQ